ncbi:MAG: hypothetical protein JWQ57_85 [Mucilaginibacter sp.]|nr:hypothetical protein [Mucilaginibacter sp.]
MAITPTIMNNALVSVIIPVYNSGKYIEQCIQSALTQTWQNIELIIVDDGSTDRSLAIIAKYENERVRVFSQEHKGSGAARNKGLAEATGEYIQFLDSDDLLSPNKIEKQLNLLLQHPGKIAVCSTVHFFDGDDPFKGSPSAYEDSFLYETDDPAEFLSNLYGGNSTNGSMIQTNAWLTPAKVIKKTGYWSEFYSPDDDGDFFCRAVLASKGIVYAKDCFNYYRKHGADFNLASKKTKQALQGKFNSFLIKKNHLLSAANNTSAKRALAKTAMGLAVESYLDNKELAYEILKIIKELGGTDYVPTIGGKPIELIKKIFGWKLALKLQRTYSKYNNR